MTLSFKRNPAPSGFPLDPLRQQFGGQKKKSGLGTVHVIPTLDELLEDDLLSGFYSKSEFTQYLQLIHCVENLTFVIAINLYIANPLLSKWKVLYQEFFTEFLDSEINLPLHCKNMVLAMLTPRVEVLLQLKRVIYDDILLDLYNEFIKEQKLKLQRQNPNALFKRREGLTTALALMVLLRLPPTLSSDCPLDCDTDHECFSPKLAPLLRGLLIGLIVDSFKMDLKKFRRRRLSSDKDLPEVVES